jgi:glycerophosphoryl diester phosphodiesterase
VKNVNAGYYFIASHGEVEVIINKNMLVAAHSGCLGTPPNSLAHVSAGLSCGADIVEIDILVTNDGVPVMCHNRTIKLASGKMVRIRELDFAQLIDAGIGVCAATEALIMVKEANRMVNLDMKSNESVPAIYKALKDLNMLEYGFLSGCGIERAGYVRNNYKDLRCMLNFEEDKDMACLAENYSMIFGNFITHAIKLNCCAINLCHEECTPELVGHALKRLMPVSVWTVDDVKMMEKLALMGISSITTNNPKELLELKERLCC